MPISGGVKAPHSLEKIFRGIPKTTERVPFFIAHLLAARVPCVFVPPIFCHQGNRNIRHFVNGKSPSFIGHATWNGCFSIVIIVFGGVHPENGGPVEKGSFQNEKRLRSIIFQGTCQFSRVQIYFVSFLDVCCKSNERKASSIRMFDVVDNLFPQVCSLITVAMTENVRMNSKISEIQQETSVQASPTTISKSKDGYRPILVDSLCIRGFCQRRHRTGQNLCWPFAVNTRTIKHGHHTTKKSEPPHKENRTRLAPSDPVCSRLLLTMNLSPEERYIYVEKNNSHFRWPLVSLSLSHYTDYTGNSPICKKKYRIRKNGNGIKNDAKS